MTCILLGLGSNIGDRLGYLYSAVHTLRSHITLVTMSRIYESSPMYVMDQPFYLNMVVVGETDQSPEAVLEICKAIEAQFGRQTFIRCGPRCLDIDLLAYGQEIHKENTLSIPHQRMAERPFVLLPLQEVMPQWHHPITGYSVAEMIAVLDCEMEIRPVATIDLVAGEHD